MANSLRRRSFAKFCIPRHSSQMSHSAGPYITDDVRFCTELIVQVHEFVRAKGVVFNDTTPVFVNECRSLIARTDPVHLVVRICEGPAGPAQIQNADLLQRLDNVSAYATHIRD